MTPSPTVDPAVLAHVGDLEQNFRKQVQRALGVDLDGSVTSLAFVDHYLTLARGETRAPILSLLSAGAGAYFGELVRREFGGAWVGRPDDPRGLRLLLGVQFLYFSPVAAAHAAILGREPEDEDLDCALHLDARPTGGADPTDDAAWILQRLEAPETIPIHPQPHHVPIHPNVTPDPIEWYPLGGQQHDPSAPRQSRRHRRPPRHRFKHRARLIRQRHHSATARPRHHATPSPEIT